MGTGRMIPRQQVQGSEFEVWESDHTALVHVLWDHGMKGTEADDLASKIMRSKWMKATRVHAVERADVVPREVAERLAQALERFGEHKDSCASLKVYLTSVGPHACDCGWSTAVACLTEDRAVFPKAETPEEINERWNDRVEAAIDRVREAEET